MPSETVGNEEKTPLFYYSGNYSETSVSKGTKLFLSSEEIRNITTIPGKT